MTDSIGYLPRSRNGITDKSIQRDGTPRPRECPRPDDKKVTWKPHCPIGWLLLTHVKLSIGTDYRSNCASRAWHEPFPCVIWRRRTKMAELWFFSRLLTQLAISHSNCKHWQKELKPEFWRLRIWRNLCNRSCVLDFRAICDWLESHFPISAMPSSALSDTPS